MKYTLYADCTFPVYQTSARKPLIALSVSSDYCLLLITSLVLLNG